MYWWTDCLSSSWVSDWCNTGLTDSDLHVQLTCIDWMITSAVALCLSDVIQDQLTVTYVHRLFNWFSRCVSDWYNTWLACRFWDFVLCLHWLLETLSTFMLITCALAEITQSRSTKTAVEHFSQLLVALFT